MLPNWVIAHGTRKKVYLSQFAWTPNRKEALSFNCKEDAARWIEEQRKATPLIFAGHTAFPLDEEYRAPEATQGGTYTHEYDPFGFDRVG